MSLFTQVGDAFMPTAGRDTFLEELPTGRYVVVTPMMGPMFFQRVEPFGEPPRLYGDVEKKAERIMRTFLDRENRTTGVLLEGEKGSGKSQLARLISYMGHDAGIPTITVNAPLFGDGFNNLLATIEQPAIVLIDEFEKVYREQEHQEAILTLLDGVSTTQKLFIFTVNDKYKVNQHMKNRPGRLYYSMEFTGLGTEFVREYCEVNLENKDNLQSVLTLSNMFYSFNFDMLKAVVEEMNRYDENAFEVVELLNAKPFSLSSSGDKFEMVVTTKTGVKSEPREVVEIPITGGSRDREVVAHYVKFPGFPELNHEDEDEDDRRRTEWADNVFGKDQVDDRIEYDGDYHLVVDAKGLRKIDADTGRYQFIAQNGMTVDYTRKPKEVAQHIPGTY